MDDIMDHISFGTIPIKMDGIPVLAYEELDFMNAYLDIVGEEFMQDLFNDEYLAYIMIHYDKDVVYTVEDLKAWHPKDKNILRKQLVDDYLRLLRLTNNEHSNNNEQSNTNKKRKNNQKNQSKKRKNKR